jgi:hypothetical protein
MLKVFAFCLDSCIVNKGEKFVHALGTWDVWKVFQLVREFFEQFGAGPVTWGGLTALGRVSRILLFVAFPFCIAAFVQGECALAQGEHAYV